MMRALPTILGLAALACKDENSPKCSDLRGADRLGRTNLRKIRYVQAENLGYNQLLGYLWLGIDR